MKKNLLFILLLLFGFVSQTQAQNSFEASIDNDVARGGGGSAMDCNALCVLDIQMSETAGFVDVTLQNMGGDINYPIIVLIVDGDTVANINQQFEFFAQLSNQTIVHTIPTTLTEIVQPFTCTVGVHDGNWDEDCVLQFPCNSVGVSSVEKIAISIYPNPASEIVNVSFDAFNLNGSKNRQLLLTDLSGRTVYSMSVSSNNSIFTLDVSDFAAGYYLMTLQDNGSILSREKLAVK